MTTVIEDDLESRATPDEVVVRSPVLCDSEVLNGSLSENEGLTDNTDATSRLPSLASDLTATPDVAPLKRISFLSLDERTDKGLSCLSLEVCASGENINMLSGDDLSGCGSSLGSVERELSSVEREQSPVVAGEDEDRLGSCATASGQEEALKDVGNSLVDLRRSSGSANAGEGMAWGHIAIGYLMKLKVRILFNLTGVLC